MQRSWVQSLVRELRFHMPKEFSKKKKKNVNQWIVSILFSKKKKNTKSIFFFPRDHEIKMALTLHGVSALITYGRRGFQVSSPSYCHITPHLHVGERPHRGAGRLKATEAPRAAPCSSLQGAVVHQGFIAITPVSSLSPPLHPSSSFSFSWFSINPSLLLPLPLLTCLLHLHLLLFLHLPLLSLLAPKPDLLLFHRKIHTQTHTQ